MLPRSIDTDVFRAVKAAGISLPPRTAEALPGLPVQWLSLPQAPQNHESSSQSSSCGSGLAFPHGLLGNAALPGHPVRHRRAPQTCTALPGDSSWAGRARQRKYERKQAESAGKPQLPALMHRVFLQQPSAHPRLNMTSAARYNSGYNT